MTTVKRQAERKTRRARESNPPSFFFDLGEQRFDLSRRTVIMGILNRTPDSFSDGGKYLKEEDALLRIEEMVRFGADIIDIGGESTRPGAEDVPLKDELGRVVPIIRQASARFKTPISVDTRKARVAEEALGAGASIVNDVTGLKGDAEMASVVKKYNAAVVLMHSRGTPQTMQENPVYSDLIGEIIASIGSSIDVALSHGIPREKIIIDPGIGFGKTVEHNLEILHRLKEFAVFDRPVLIGVSRKSFIGRILEKEVDDRLEGSIAASVIAMMNGARILRTHDVRSMRDVATMVDAVIRNERWQQ